MNTGTYLKPSTLLLKDYLLEWMRDKQHTIGRQTAENHWTCIHKHINPIIGNIPLTKLTTFDVQKFTTRLVEKGLAPATVKRIFNIVHTALNKAEKMQLVNKNVASLIDKPKVTRKELDVWDTDEVNAFLELAKTTRYYIAYHLAVMTGMRQGEILGLRWLDVDFERRKLFIRQTLSHDGKTFNVGAKTASSVRSVTLDELTVKRLQEHQRKQENEKRLAQGVFIDKGLVISTSTGNQLNPRDLKKIFDRIINDGGLRKITFHDLRHTHASLLLKQNIHPKIVSERLGHSSIQMTLDTSHI
ncbi:tyrosine-type recombinase/integrase [Cohnella rhizosphaerae]